MISLATLEGGRKDWVRILLDRPVLWTASRRADRPRLRSTISTASERETERNRLIDRQTERETETETETASG
jgi:hypothetical protein